MSEATFIEALRSIATHPAARGLMDDAAVLDIGGTAIVCTHDMIVEGVHFLPDDPPEDVAWKLAAVNLSDLAGKGARPIGVLMGYGLTGDSAWDARFIDGLRVVLETFETPLLGGDTVSLPRGAPRAFGLTAIGQASDGAPPRDGAQAGDALWVTGTIGEAGYGLALLQAGVPAPAAPITAYRRPRPLLAEGQALAVHVHAMMDISDGLLIDAQRMAEASGLAVEIDLEAMPLSSEVAGQRLEARALRLSAATAGDDYQLLFAAPCDAVLPVAATRVGRFSAGAGLALVDRTGAVPLPGKLGYMHD